MAKEKQNFEKWGRVNRDPSISHGLFQINPNQSKTTFTISFCSYLNLTQT